MRTRRRSSRHLHALCAAIVVAGACASDPKEPVASPAPTATAATIATTTTTASVAPSTTAPSTTTPATETTAANPSPSPATKVVLDAILHAHLGDGEFVGARIAVTSSDGTTTEASAGTETTDPASASVDLDVPWGIGSVTKTFVSVVVLQLAEADEIDLDAGIGGFLPGLAGADQITPRQLLQHTSGLGEYLDDPLVLDDARREWTSSELIAVAESGGRFGPPGGPAHYSNANFIVLGEIIEQITGAPWVEAVRMRIVEPLGLTGTGLVGAGSATGYTLAGGVFTEATHRFHPSIGGAAGGLESTNRDLLRLATGLASGALLSPGSQAAMQSFVPGEDYSTFGIVHSYGLGVERYENDEITVVGHLGSSAAHSAFFGFDVERGTAVSVMLNSNNPGPQAVMAIETLVAVAEAGGEYDRVAGPTMPGSTQPPPAPGKVFDGIYFAYLHEGPASEDPHLVQFDVVQAFSGADCVERFGDRASQVCTPIGTDRSGPTARVEQAVVGVPVSVRDLDSQASYSVSGRELLALVHGGTPAATAPPGFAFSGGFGFLLTFDAGALIRIDQPAATATS